MRECAFCGVDCDSQIGLSRELKTVYWGGKHHGSVEYSPKVVTFFCSEQHRNDFLVSPLPTGEVQTKRRDIDDDESSFGFS